MQNYVNFQYSMNDFLDCKYLSNILRHKIFNFNDKFAHIDSQIDIHLS